MYRVISTKSFIKGYSKFFDKDELVKFSKFKEKLKLNPFIGRPLRVNYVREFKTNKGKRAYFIVYEEFSIVLFISYSNKKEQKVSIDRIFERVDEYYILAYKHHYNS